MTRQQMISIALTKCASTKLKAVIIEGNRDYMSGPGKKLMDPFYNRIHAYLENKGYSVTRDPGLPYTNPPNADLYIAHSRGVDRLRYAPKGTKLLAFGSNPNNWKNSKDIKIVNHPLEPLTNKPAMELTPEEREAHIHDPRQKYHFVFTHAMRRAIDDLTP